MKHLIYIPLLLSNLSFACPNLSGNYVFDANNCTFENKSGALHSEVPENIFSPSISVLENITDESRVTSLRITQNGCSSFSIYSNYTKETYKIMAPSSVEDLEINDGEDKISYNTSWTETGINVEHKLKHRGIEYGMWNFRSKSTFRIDKTDNGNLVINYESRSPFVIIVAPVSVKNSYTCLFERKEKSKKI